MKSTLLCLAAIVAVSWPVSTSSAVEPVKLGTDDLTSGIPGSGPLAMAEIKAWLADPANHESWMSRFRSACTWDSSAFAVWKRIR